MKIATICNLPPPFGGAEVFSKGLASYLAQAGVEISIFTQNQFEIQLDDKLEILRYPHLNEHQSDLVDNGIKIYPLFTTSFLSKSRMERNEKTYMKTRKNLEKLVLNEKPDLIHCHSTTTKMKEAVFVSQKMNIPLVMTVHGMTTLKSIYDSNVIGSLTSKKILSLLRRCSQVVAVSGESLDYCHAHGCHNVCQIPTGIDREYFNFVDHNQRTGILYVGKVNRHKGLKETIEAFLKIEHLISEDLHLVGRGVNIDVFNKTDFYLNADNKNKFLRLWQKGRIHLLGELFPSELRELYRSKKLLVLPSLTEGMPLVILEALSCGMPVIASNVGAIPDIIKDKINGYLISKGNWEELANSIIKLMNHNNPNMALFNRDSVKEYDIKKITEIYLQLFRKVLKGNNIS